MPKEYRTIEEVAGPLMLVRDVTDVNYNELGEIELANGEKRRCKVLEIDGGNALVQLFESSTGINLYEAGEVDSIDLAAEQIDKFKDSPEFKSSKNATTFFIMMNATE